MATGMSRVAPSAVVTGISTIPDSWETVASRAARVSGATFSISDRKGTNSPNGTRCTLTKRSTQLPSASSTVTSAPSRA